VLADRTRSITLIEVKEIAITECNCDHSELFISKICESASGSSPADLFHVTNVKVHIRITQLSGDSLKALEQGKKSDHHVSQ
jgi:hypothetical protein